ncbi:MAG TPA: VWA domain-containing protein [Acidobacteriaceae bacterium]|jgi:VWFA-related protein|nr:VWA domain-containing protein [Acidobacteriaceae bacterium]
MRAGLGWLRASALTLLPFLAAPLLHAQSSSDIPQYRTSTHLVQFGVIVRDKTRPVGSLTTDDFVVLDRGKPQMISVFQAEWTSPPAIPHAPLPPNTFSDESRYNGEPPRAVTIILLDNLNTAFGSGPQPYEDTPLWLEDHALGRAKERLLSFLQQMDPRDRVAIYGLTERLRVLCDFTCSREQLLAVLRAYDAGAKTARESADPQDFHLPNAAPAFNQAIDEDTHALAEINNERRAALTMATLTAIAQHVADLPGRKNLLWLTADVPASGEAIAAVLARANLVAYPVDARGLLPTEVIPQGPTGVPPGQSAMVDMAADTGGHAFLNTNNLTDAIRQVVEDSAPNYTLGFYLPQDEVDGKFHRIRVEVKKPGTALTYARGYFAFRDRGSSEDDRHNAFLEAIRSPLDSSAVRVDVRLARVEQPAHTLQVVGVAGIGGLPFEQRGDVRTGALEIYAVEQDAAGNVLAQVNQQMNLKLSEQQYRAYLKSGVLFRGVVALKPGATVLRVLVQEAGTAELGCVIVPLDRVK